MMIGQRRPIDPLAPLPEPMAPMLGAPPMAQPMTLAPPAPEKHKTPWLAILADALSGLAGQPGQYPQRAAREREEQTAFERGEQQYRRQRADHLADNQADYDQRIALEEWKRANPAPADDQFSRYMDAAQIPAEQRPGIYQKRIEAMINPPRYMTGPNGEIIQIGGQAPAPAALPMKPRTFSTLPKGAVPLANGGAGSPAPRGFR